MRALLPAVLLVATLSPVAGAEECDPWIAPVELACGVGTPGVEIEAYRIDEAHYHIRASACLAAPGELLLVWGVTLAEPPAGAQRADSRPTGQAACPHHAVVQPTPMFGTFDPPEVCGLVLASTSEGGLATRAVCEHD